MLPSFEITNRFWRLHLKANFWKVPSNIAVVELSSSTREICRPRTSHLMMQQQLEHAARRSNRDGNQPNSAILPDQCLFCKKSKYKPNTSTREKLHSVQEFLTDDVNVPYPANYMIPYRGISVQIITQPISFSPICLEFFT